MATFTVTTAVNIDSLAGKTGSDTYTINGGYLTIDQHTRYGTNQSTSAAMGTVTLSATLGGTIEFNSTKVRLIPYDTGTGNVPALDTTISQGSASGILLGVYSALNVAPTTAGSTMPVTGYILIRQWNSVAYAAGALSGVGANATDVDGPGWLEIVGVDALVQTCNRLGSYLVQGDYYYFQGATTDGVRATTYQIPSNGSNVYVGGVEVETGAGSGVYEFYPNAGSASALITSIATDELRGRWCWVSTAGLVRFGHDGTNSTGGFIPEAGRRIRIPNIFFACCAAIDRTVNTIPHPTVATRMEFSTGGGGVVSLNTCCMNWYCNFAQPYSVTLTNLIAFDIVVLSECASPITWSNVGVGQSAALSNYGFTGSLNFAGGSMTNCTWTRAVLSSSGNYVCSWVDMIGFTVVGERTHGLALSRGNASTGSATRTRVSDSTFTNCVSGAGKIVLATCTNITDTGRIYYDRPTANTIATNGAYVWELSSACADITLSNLSHGGLYMSQAYNGILAVNAAACTRIKLRNIGSYASPVSLGSPRRDLVSWSRVTTTATVTSVAHGLVVGDTIYVPVTSAVTAITVAAKTVVAVPDADTFTFTCLNAGATSGTISYFGTKSANLVVFAAAAAANDVRIQRCYTPHTRTNLFTADNSSKNILFESVHSDFLNAFVTPMLNARFKGVTGTPALTAQTSCYGTHWLDVYNADVTVNLTAQAWTRVTTVATVTSTDHKLRTGMLINVKVSSDTAAIVIGTKTITVLDANTFTFTCLNAGATSGTLTFRTAIDRLILMMNEATAETAGHYSDVVGTAAFTSAGGLATTNGSSIVFNMLEYRLGVTGFPINEVVMAGATLTNYTLSYKIDKNDGNGFSADWHNLYYERTGASGTSGQFTFTVTDATGVEIGDHVWGTGIGGLAQVTNVAANTITVDIANTATVSGTARFNHLPSETGLTNEGLKLALRVAKITTNTAAITAIAIYVDTDDTSRALLYPLDTVPITVTVKDVNTGDPIENARVFIEAGSGGPATLGTDILTGLTNASGVISGTTEYTAQPVTGRVRRATVGYGTLYKSAAISSTIESDGLALTVLMIPDE